MVNINHRCSLPLGTLASVTTIKETAPINLSEDFQMESMKLMVSIKDHGSGQGPLYLALADDILTNAQLAAYWTAGGPQGPSDIVDAEEAKRPIIPLGVFSMTTSQFWGFRGQINSVWQKFSHLFEDVSGPAFHVFNNDDAALTGNARVDVFSRYKGRWI